MALSNSNNATDSKQLTGNSSVGTVNWSVSSVPYLSTTYLGFGTSNLSGTSNVNPTTLTWRNVPAGTYTINVAARDSRPEECCKNAYDGKCTATAPFTLTVSTPVANCGCFNVTKTPTIYGGASLEAKVAFGNSRFVSWQYDGTTCKSPTYNKPIYSTDGVNWTTGSGCMPPTTYIAFGNGVFISSFSSCAATTNATSKSTDGLTWTAITTGTGGYEVVHFANGYFYAFGGGSSYPTTLTVRRSLDGSAWSNAGSVTLGNSENMCLNALAYGRVNGSDRYIATFTHSLRVATSTNGTSWSISSSNVTSNPTIGQAGFSGVAFGNGVFVIAPGSGGFGKAQYVYVSSNGTSWRDYVIYSETPEQWRGILFVEPDSQNGLTTGIFVMYGNTSFATSIDGQSWKVCREGGGAGTGVPTAYGNGMLVGDKIKATFKSPFPQDCQIHGTPINDMIITDLTLGAAPFYGCVELGNFTGSKTFTLTGTARGVNLPNVKPNGLTLVDSAGKSTGAITWTRVNETTANLSVSVTVTASVPNGNCVYVTPNPSLTLQYTNTSVGGSVVSNTATVYLTATPTDQLTGPCYNCSGGVPPNEAGTVINQQRFDDCMNGPGTPPSEHCLQVACEPTFGPYPQPHECNSN